jgi:uncharacterized protein (DUF1499 family)
MRCLRWFTRNWAETDPDDPGLSPVTLRLELAQALVQVEEALRHLPRWQIESVDAATASIRATRRTKLLHFVDDIHIRLEPVAGATKVHGRSQSHFGFADLGQNRRNLRELWNMLELLSKLAQ